jgi:hypothetical protein
MNVLRQIWTILASVCVAAALAVAVPQFSGCAAGTNPLGSVLLPQSFPERLAAGYSLNAAVRQSAVTLLQSKTITADDGESVLQTTDAARAGLDVARSLAQTDLTSAEAKLAATHTVLVALQSYLASREK